MTLDGNRVTGISYCLTTLFSEQDGKIVKQTIGVIYNDKYVKQDGKWLISKRISNFTWQD